MVRNNQYLVSLYANNFLLSHKTLETLEQRIAQVAQMGGGIHVVVGGLPTNAYDPHDVAAIVYNMRVEQTSTIEWRIYGDIETVNTTYGMLLSTTCFDEWQFWVRGGVMKNTGLIEFSHLSFTAKSAQKRKFVSYEWKP